MIWILFLIGRNYSCLIALSTGGVVLLKRLTGGLDQGNLVASGVMLHLVHEHPHEEQSPPAGFKDIGRIGGIRQSSRVETGTFVLNHVDCLGAGDLDPDGNLAA